MTDRHFTATVHQEEDHFWAEIAELPGCFATGDDLDELREALEEAISLYLHDRPDGGKLTDMTPQADEPPAPMRVDEMRVSVLC